MARRAAPPTGLHLLPVAAFPAQGAITPRHRPADVVEHEAMLVRFGQRRAFIAKIAGLFDRFFDRAGENYGHVEIFAADPLPKSEAPALCPHVGEDDLDFQFGRLQGKFRLLSVRRFDDCKAALAEILRQRKSRDDIAFDQKNDWAD